MLTKQFLVAAGGMVFVSAQVPPPTGILSTVLSGVLPVLPTETPFTGLETIEGAIVNDGPLVVGFTGELAFLEFLGGLPYSVFHSNNHALLPQNHYSTRFIRFPTDSNQVPAGTPQSKPPTPPQPTSPSSPPRTSTPPPAP